MDLAVSDLAPGTRMVLIDRPQRRNAVTLATVDELKTAIDAPGLEVVILGSTDRRSFSAGVDLDIDDAERAATSRALYDLYEAMLDSKAIIVTAVSGYAVGAGAQLLLASDIRIAHHDSRIRFMGPGHGLAVGAWGLPSLVGRGRAMDIALSMRWVSGDEAHRIGLVDRLEDDPLEAATEFAGQLASLSGSARTAVKRIAQHEDLRRALATEAEHNAGWPGTMPPRQPE